MKVTPQLVEWVSAKRREKGWSYGEMARRSGLSWEYFRKLERFMVHDVRDASEIAMCKLFGITRDNLVDIAGGRISPPGLKDDPDIRSAEALLRWVRKDENRAFALKAMGYKGDL
jgi:transcriptional regulator with XRE-family HTH domain